MAESALRKSSIEGHPNVFVLTLDRPPVNALALETYDEIARTFASVGDDPAVRAIVLTGGGERAFSAGADLKAVSQATPATTEARARAARVMFEAIRHAPVPVIAAVNGVALGAGLVVASVCDVIVASDRARFGLPEIDVGLMGGTKHLGRLVPPGVMRWMAFTGARVDGDFLARFGAVHSVVPADRLMPAALAIADEIAGKSPAAIRMMKQMIDLTEELPVAQGYRAEQLATMLIAQHPHAKEAARAALEKRKPRFED
jgi:enoyl-CoA hydratase